MKKTVNIKTIIKKGELLLSGQTFFLIVVAIFAFQALWIAFTFKYPMVYDEYYHYGLIKVFSNHLLPFVYNQPLSYDTFGDVSREGSLLFHYLLSFPYRLIALITDNLAVQVIGLRLLNIAAFGAGLVLFAKLFRLLGIQQIYTNVALLFFVLLPITPFVAAHINYDNVIFPLTALFLIVCAKAVKAKAVDWRVYAALLAVGLFASLVKFSFLPIFAAGVIFVAFYAFQTYGKKFGPGAVQSFRATSKLTAVGVLAVVILFGALFVERYVVNVALYGTPNPSCFASMEEARCLSNGISSRNAGFLETKDEREVGNVTNYILVYWLRSMHEVLHMSGSNDAGPNQEAVFTRPLPIAAYVTSIIIAGGLMTLLYAWRSLKKNNLHYLLLTVSLAYIGAVLVENISIYYKYNLPIAIQARYLLPVLPILGVFAVIALSFVTRKVKHVRLILVVVALGFLTQGAGLVTHIVRSDSTWYWQNEKVIYINQQAQQILRPLVKEE